MEISFFVAFTPATQPKKQTVKAAGELDRKCHSKKQGRIFSGALYAHTYIGLLRLKSSSNVFVFAAHEITHAFDDVGIQYDEFGRFTPLYDNQTVADFHRSSDCVRWVSCF